MILRNAAAKIVEDGDPVLGVGIAVVGQRTPQRQGRHVVAARRRRKSVFIRTGESGRGKLKCRRNDQHKGCEKPHHGCKSYSSALACARMKPAFLTVAAALLALLGLPTAATAQTGYPAKPVRLMVGASPGGGTDIVARMLADKFAERLKGTYVVENKPGASNTIAADLTAKAAPDGHTLLVATNTGQAIAPHLLKLNFDAIKDLTPIGLVVSVPNVLVVGPTVTAKSVAELVALMKAKPGTLKYGSSGVGSTQHIAGEAFDVAAGTKGVHVPYKGSAQAHLDIISGTIDMMFDTTSSAMGQIRGGKLRPLAVTSTRRSGELPEVPTLAEAGVPGLEMTTWYAVYVTAGSPAEIVERLQAELAHIVALPDVQEKLRGLGGVPGGMSVADFVKFNHYEYERYGRLIREAGIKSE
jgi:tripartite-type tricarboxylate transporter receptor subunit TctC